MDTLIEFRKKVSDILNHIDNDALSYNENEFWMIRPYYEYLEYFAEKNRLINTALALPLSRGLHNGSYRKNAVIRNGVEYHPPYVIHCLIVCKMLADSWLPLTSKEKDVLLAASLCHDMIEDLAFKDSGREIVTVYHLDEEVYEVVKVLSKQKNMSADDEKNYYHGIEQNKLALLVKLSDRGHNVTDLYNMSEKKIREYINETRNYVLPMCDYGREHYPELAEVLEIRQDQLICLTRAVDILSRTHEKIQKDLTKELEDLRNENESLHSIYEKLKREVK